MPRHAARVANCADHSQAFKGALLNSLRQLVCEIALLKIAAGRNVHDANVVFITMVQDPYEATPNLIFRNATRQSDLNEHEICVRGDAAINTFGKRATA